MRIAVPCDGQQVAAHFGHAAQFTLFDANPETGEITAEKITDAPPHQPGLLPPWLAEQGAEVILAGGMGGRARQLLDGHGITVVAGVQEANPRKAVEDYLKGDLSTEANPCDH